MTHTRLALIPLLVTCVASIAAAQESPRSYALTFPGYPTAKVQVVQQDGQTWLEVSDPHGHRYEAAAYFTQRDGGFVLESGPLRFKKPKAGASQALGQILGASTSPGAPRLGEGPLSHKRLRLEVRDGRVPSVKAALQDVRRPQIEEGTGVVDWAGEVARLERGEGTSQGELKRAKEHLERNRAAEVESGDLSRVRAATTKLRDELSEIGRELDEGAVGPESEALRRRAEDTKDALTRAARAREALELAEVESKDAERIGKVTQGLHDRLVKLRARIADLPASSREAQVLRGDEVRTEGLLHHALKKREAAELALAESKDLDRIDQGVTLARARLVDLLTRTREIDPQSRERESLFRDRARTEGLLHHTLKKREAAELSELDSKDPARIASAVDRIRDRVASLSSRASQERHDAPAAHLYRQDEERSEGLLHHGLKKREEAEKKAVESKRPHVIQAATDGLQTRLYRLETRLGRPDRETPASRLLRVDADRTHALLDYAGRKQVTADRLQIESKNLFLINQAGKRISQRLRGLEALERQAHAEGRLIPSWLTNRKHETEALYRLAQEARAAALGKR
jgi:hypothetical protein